MNRKNIKELIHQNKPVLGGFIFSRSQFSIEVMADIGYDFVIIDAEHSLINLETIEHLITAADSVSINPFVRVQENANLVQRVLDCGAAGVMAPLINNAQEAQEIVNAAKYAPIGKRNYCISRSNIYGYRGTDYMLECYKKQNEDTIVIVQIETISAIENLPKILEIDGIDCIFIGPWDLSNSLGVAGKSDNTKLEEKIQEVVSVANDKGIPIGIAAWNGEDANNRVKQGFNLITMLCDVTLFANAARLELEKVER